MYSFDNEHGDIFKKDFDVDAILRIDSICYESIPCQHNVKYRFNGKDIERY